MHYISGDQPADPCDQPDYTRRQKKRPQKARAAASSSIAAASGGHVLFFHHLLVKIVISTHIFPLHYGFRHIAILSIFVIHKSAIHFSEKQYSKYIPSKIIYANTEFIHESSRRWQSPPTRCCTFINAKIAVRLYIQSFILLTENNCFRIIRLSRRGCPVFSIRKTRY
jgi:hypothetical protein